MDDQYVRGRALSLEQDASDVIKEVESNYEWMNWEGEPDVNDPDVELIDKEDAVMGDLAASGNAESNDKDSDNYVRQRGYARDGPEVGWTEGHEFVMRTSEVKDRLLQIEKVNEKLREEDSRRRYVATKADAPKNAYTYEDKFGPYYFKTDTKIRPSDVAGINEDDSWYSYDEKEKVLKSIIALAEKYPEMVQKAAEIEQVYTFTDRVLKTEDEVVRDPDVFSLEQQDGIVSTIVQARGTATDEDKEKATTGDLRSVIESVRRSISISRDEIKSEAPRYVQSDIDRADKELGEALEFLRDGKYEAVEVSVVQACDKLGEVLYAMKGESSDEVYDTLQMILNECRSAKNTLRSM